MVGTSVLYHRDADAPGEAAIVVGVHPGPVIDDATGERAGDTLNLLVLPDGEDVDLEAIAAAMVEAPGQGWGAPDPAAPQLAPPAVEIPGWFPFRATEVPRDQPGQGWGAPDPAAPQLAPPAVEIPGWFPFRATEVPRDQPGQASGPYWSPLG